METIKNSVFFSECLLRIGVQQFFFEHHFILYLLYIIIM